MGASNPTRYFFMPDRLEQEASIAPTNDFSLSNFFHDAYKDGIFNAVIEHPKEAAVTALGIVASVAAAEFLAGSGAAGQAIDAAAEDASQAIKPATEGLINAGLPITAENRAAAAALDGVQVPAWGRGAAVRGGENYLNKIGASVTDAVLPRSAVQDLFNSGMPITSANRAAAISPELLKSPAWARGQAIRGGENYLDFLKSK